MCKLCLKDNYINYDISKVTKGLLMINAFTDYSNEYPCGICRIAYTNHMAGNTNPLTVDEWIVNRMQLMYKKSRPLEEQKVAKDLKERRTYSYKTRLLAARKSYTKTEYIGIIKYVTKQRIYYEWTVKGNQKHFARGTTESLEEAVTLRRKAIIKHGANSSLEYYNKPAEANENTNLRIFSNTVAVSIQICGYPPYYKTFNTIEEAREHRDSLPPTWKQDYIAETMTNIDVRHMANTTKYRVRFSNPILNKNSATFATIKQAVAHKKKIKEQYDNTNT